MPLLLWGDLPSTHMRFFNPKSGPQNTPPNREVFQLGVFFLPTTLVPPPTGLKFGVPG